jgi:nitrogen fixation NifU-like protein
MRTELDELYQDLILDHSKSPRNFGHLQGARCKAEGYNPLCGDHFSVFLDVKDGVIDRAAFHGTGCAISTSSASLMTEALRGLSVDDASALFDRVHALVTGKDDPGTGPDLGKLEAFHGVRNFPMRVKCATLAWHTMKAALAGNPETVSTE